MAAMFQFRVLEPFDRRERSFLKVRPLTLMVLCFKGFQGVIMKGEGESTLTGSAESRVEVTEASK
jgi:hypothetical protein